MSNNSLQSLKYIIDSSANIVFFGGAGVSTESGIPDFRSRGGLYKQQYPHPPEVMLSASYFHANPELFFDFYRNKMIYPDVKPNNAHIALAKLEADGKLKGVITQNIDGLHQEAGSITVLELHGSAKRNYCMLCSRTYSVSVILECGGVPYCDCGGIIRPDVILYEEGLNQQLLADAKRLVRSAEVLIVGGTSLNVYPAAGLVDIFNGRKLVLINKDATNYDSDADLILRESIGEVLSAIV